MKLSRSLVRITVLSVVLCLYSVASFAQFALSVSKAFSPTMVAPNQTSTMTITISNLNGAASTVSFTDNYPSGLVNQTAFNTSTSGCSSGGLTGTAGGGSVSTTNLVVPAFGTCSVSVDVTSASDADYTNTLTAGSVTGTNTAPSGADASATLTVATPPQALVVTKSFTPTSIAANGTSTLQINVTNPNAVQSSISFTDTYPSGIVNKTPFAEVTFGCAGGAATGTAGGNTLTGALTVAPSATCIIEVDTTGSTPGMYTNTLPAGSVTGSGAAANVTDASATLTIVAALVAPTVSKSFSPTAIATNGSSTLTVRLTNPNSTAITGAAFTDTYPSGLVNAATPNPASTCGGSASASAGGNSLALSGGTIPASGQCTVTVSVTSSANSQYTNTIAAGGVTSANAPASGAAASGTITVQATTPPPPGTAVPTLSIVGLGALLAALALVAVFLVRK